jgi:hypothetical protein
VERRRGGTLGVASCAILQHGVDLGFGDSEPIRCQSSWSAGDRIVLWRTSRWTLAGRVRSGNSARMLAIGVSPVTVLTLGTSELAAWAGSDNDVTPSAKKNFASAWANHTASRSAQNDGSRTATLDTSAGGELSAASMLLRGHQCGMSILVAKTTYDFIAGRRKLFRAGCACWIPGGAFCVAGSWLAVGRNCGPEKGRRAFFFWYSRAMGWTPGGALCVAASWLA